jgi:hypothetical protein
MIPKIKSPRPTLGRNMREPFLPKVQHRHVLALEINCGTTDPLGSNTSSAIVLSPPVQFHSHAADVEQHVAVMASNGETRSGLLEI